ncbi:hypothetical protein D3C72_1729180 [compost metagenome]
MAFLRQAPVQQFQASGNAHEQVVEVMRQSARQLAHGFHLLALPQRVFGLAQGLGLGALGADSRRGLDDRVDHARDVSVLVAHRAVAEGEVRHFRAAVAVDFQRKVFDEGCLAGVCARGDGTDLRPGFAPDVAEGSAQGVRLGAQDGREGVVVDRDQSGPPDQAAGEPGRQHHAGGDAQRGGPCVDRTQWRSGPIVARHPRSHVAAAG